MNKKLLLSLLTTAIFLGATTQAAPGDDIEPAEMTVANVEVAGQTVSVYTSEDEVVGFSMEGKLSEFELLMIELGGGGLQLPFLEVSEVTCCSAECLLGKCTACCVGDTKSCECKLGAAVCNCD